MLPVLNEKRALFFARTEHVAVVFIPFDTSSNGVARLLLKDDGARVFFSQLLEKLLNSEPLSELGVMQSEHYASRTILSSI